MQSDFKWAEPKLSRLFAWKTSSDLQRSLLVDHTHCHILLRPKSEVRILRSAALHNTYIEAASYAHARELNGDATILAHVSPFQFHCLVLKGKTWEFCPIPALLYVSQNILVRKQIIFRHSFRVMYPVLSLFAKWLASFHACNFNTLSKTSLDFAAPQENFLLDSPRNLSIVSIYHRNRKSNIWIGTK